MARFAIGDTVLIPVTIREASRHPAGGSIPVRVGLPGWRYSLWVNTADLTGEALVRVKVCDTRCLGGLVQVEAVIGTLRQLVWMPCWAVRRAAPDSIR